MTWRDDAACNGLDTNLFHPNFHSTHLKSWRAIEKAKTICRGCPVRIPCLEEALRYEAADGHLMWGVWGGTTPQERSRIRRRSA